MQNIANTVTSALTWAQAQGLERIDAQWLLLHVLGQPDAGRAWLIAHGGDTLTGTLYEHFSALCARRAADEPVAYLTGQKGFYGLNLQVDARVLDPRPDTETLVDWALECLTGHTAPRGLDLGTGSGAIALAIATERTGCRVWGTDRSADALAVARANLAGLGMAGSGVQLVEGSWFGALPGDLRDGLAEGSTTRTVVPVALAAGHEVRGVVQDALIDDPARLRGVHERHDRDARCARARPIIDIPIHHH